MITHIDSHLDHGFTKPQIEYILTSLALHSGFFIEEIQIPAELGTVPCGLHGPIMGDAPVIDAECKLERRGKRDYVSRMCDREPHRTSTVTVIAGPHDGFACVLFTAYGGPRAPQEPTDPGCKDPETSRAFWAEHALSREVQS